MNGDNSPNTTPVGPADDQNNAVNPAAPVTPADDHTSGEPTVPTMPVDAPMETPSEAPASEAPAEAPVNPAV